MYRIIYKLTYYRKKPVLIRKGKTSTCQACFIVPKHSSALKLALGNSAIHITTVLFKSLIDFILDLYKTVSCHQLILFIIDRPNKSKIKLNQFSLVE